MDQDEREETLMAPNEAGPSSHGGHSKRASASSSVSMGGISEDGSGSLLSPGSSSSHGHGVSWETGRGQGRGGVRTSRMMKFGLSPPPPPGPPPSNPPPLPPINNASSSRTSSRLSFASRPPALPSAPPPRMPLPAIPGAGAGAGPGPLSSPVHVRAHTHARQPSGSSSSRHSRGSGSGSRSTPPHSPNPALGGGGPSISPRSSSLLSPAQMPSPGTFDSPGASGSGSRRDRDVRPPRTPSRHLLQSALDLAQRAVEMDKNNEVIGALNAYREAVTRLKSVMERVGVDPARNDGNGNGTPRRRNTVGKSEEEGRTLRGIHDAYVARIELLSSYENGTEPLPAHEHPSPSPSASGSGSGSTTAQLTANNLTQHSTVSTSTLTPDRARTHAHGHAPQPSPGSDRTPRGSMDETAHMGIGNLMLSDDTSPDAATGDATPHPPPPATAPNLDLRSSVAGSSMSLQQALDQVVDGSAPNTNTHANGALPTQDGSMSHLGLGRPSTSPKRVLASLGPAIGTADGRGDEDERLVKTPTEMYENGIHDPRPGSSLSGFSRAIEAQRRSLASEAAAEERPLPPLPQSAPPADSSGQPVITSRVTSLTGASFPRHPDSEVVLINSSTADGTISQRRTSRPPGPNSVSSLSDIMSPSSNTSTPFPSSMKSGAIADTGSLNHARASLLTSSSTSPGAPRIRARSQPGHWASPSTHDLPPLPSMASGAGAGSRYPYGSGGGTLPRRGLSISTDHSNGLAPPVSINSKVSTPRSITSSLISPVPETQPSDMAQRPFHLLRVLHSSMDPMGSGAYLTGSIHVASHIWRSPNPPSANGHAHGRGVGPPKIAAQDVKARCIEALSLHLEIVRSAGIPLLDGVRDGKYGSISNLRSIPPPRVSETVLIGMAGEFADALEALEEEMDNCHKNLVKAGVVVGPWKGKGKKSGKAGGAGLSWGSRISRSMDKMTSGKTLDSPEKYVDLLAHFCSSVQTINDHLVNFSGACTPAYHSLSPKAYGTLEARTRKAAEFVGVVMVPFILDDFKQFFLRYLKSGLRYLDEGA